MYCQIISAGFGGQGILFLGNLLARAGLREGREVAYFPTYGVAMRGGTANCIVTIADDEIGSPLLSTPDAAIIMNEPSLVKFQPEVREGGVIVANESIIDRDVCTRGDQVRLEWVRATEIAREVAGTERVSNLVSLGAFLRVEPVVSAESVEAVLDKTLTGDKRVFLEKNVAAFRVGLGSSAE